MATESPMRMLESSQASKWISSKDAAAFGSSLKSKATEDLGFFFKGQKFNLDQADLIPSRSGSAPPSMEGSVGNIIAMKKYSLNSNRTSLGNFKYEGKWLIDPSYDVNLNPRLPLQSHIDVSTASGKETQSLSTHKEMMASSEQALGNMVHGTSILTPGQNAALLASRHKSLVDLIQEDFPRTPSPVYNQSHLSSHATVEDSVDLGVQAMTLGVSSMNISNLSDSTSSPPSVVETDSSSTSNLILNEVSPETFPSLQHADGNKSVQENQTCNKGAGMKDDVSTNEVAHTEEHKRTFHAEVRRHKPEGQQHNIRHKPNQSFTHGFPFQVPAKDMQVISQRINNSQDYLGEVSHGHGHAHFSSFGVQTSLPSPGFGGPLYATPAPFMTTGNQCYPNLQSSGLFTPQYNLGGYAMNSTLFPPYMAGYSSQAGLPLPFGATCGLNVNGQATSVLSRDGISSTIDFQNRNKFHGHHGLALQPSYLDPLHMHYYPRPFENSYAAALQLNQSAPGAHTREHQGLDLDGQKFQSLVNDGLTLPSLRSTGFTRSSYFGNSSGMGVMMQFPALSPGSPVLPSSPIDGTHFQGVHIEIKMPQVSGRNSEFCSGQRAIGSFDDPRKQSVIEELKSINSGKFELADIAGRILEFSIDQHGSRFIQQKLESCSSEEKVSVFQEVLSHASKLMTDVFGNYVIQKFFEHGSPDQRRKLADQLSGQILPLSLQMYGCRVIQKALEFIEYDQKIQLVQELDGHVMKCVRDQNGNHVIQKCIECIPMDKIHFIISSFQGQVPTLSTHSYGCRVIQRVLEHCSNEQQIQCIVDEILESACSLAQDQYGNYVTQHVLERGQPHERKQIISKLTGKIVQMSQHKYASNVIEKCLEHGSASERELLIEEIMGQSGQGDNLLVMMKDQFANYVVQKILETSNDGHREILLNHIRVHLHALKKYTYGKHIVARFEQLVGPESEAEVH